MDTGTTARPGGVRGEGSPHWRGRWSGREKGKEASGRGSRLGLRWAASPLVVVVLG